MRLAQGLSLADLVKEINGLVTRQALCKYKNGQSVPSPEVTQRLAKVFGLTQGLMTDGPPQTIHCVPAGYRHYAGIPKKEKKRIEAMIAQTMEARLRTQTLLYPSERCGLPKAMLLTQAEQAEVVAKERRKKWNLGTGPIASVVGVLENQGVHVLEVEADKRFDGIAIMVKNAQEKRLGAAVVNRSDTCGERERLSLNHEFGHLVLELPDNKKGEGLAFRFAGAFLAPAEAPYSKLGKKRSCIQAEEFIILKQYFGISIQALLYRLYHLDIINQSYLTWWFREPSALGWRRREPCEILQEKPPVAAPRGTARTFGRHTHAQRYPHNVRGFSTVSRFLDKAGFGKQTREERRSRTLKQVR